MGTLDNICYLNLYDVNFFSLQIIIMSATMNVDHFAKYFPLVKVLYIEGRIHKIDKFYSPVPQDDYLEAALITIFQVSILCLLI